MKKLLALLLATVISVSLLAGCAGGSQPTSQSAPAQADAFEENLVISAWMHTDDNNDGLLSETNENPLIDYLSKKFNVKFEWQIPPIGSEAEQMSLMIGSGDYTDVFDAQFSQNGPEELLEDGVIQDLTAYVEQYMPNYLAYINSNETAKKSAYTADGKIIFIPVINNEPTLSWGGLMYDHEVLVKMTDGNVAFPSGNDEPTTVEDWEYMLDLMKQYYAASGLTDYATLILPASGYFQAGDILTGFGTTGSYYVDQSGKLQFGLTNQEFYNYLVTMKDWYKKGYIYQDFASRSSDPFYFPNPALTWSGSAGLFYGLIGQLDGNMSMPDAGLVVDYRAVAAPLDTANGAAYLPANSMIASNLENNVFKTGWVASKTCSEEKLIRFLQLCDFLFSEEGSMMKSYGLTKEQAGDNAVYARLGLADGAYWMENGTLQYNPVLDPFTGEATIKEEQLRGHRLPGLYNKTYYNQKTSEVVLEADKVWVSNGYSQAIPVGVSLTVEEIAENAPLATAYNDYINSMVPKFIMGTEPLTEESFAAFVKKVNSLGLTRSMEINQQAYDRYIQK